MNCMHPRLHGNQTLCALCRIKDSRAQRKQARGQRRAHKVYSERKRLRGPELKAEHARVNTQRRLEKYGF